MRLRLTYQIDRVPIDYRASFVSLIKEAIRTADDEAFHLAYESAARSMKPFCFSVFFQDFKINNGMIEIGGLTNLNVSLLNLLVGTEQDRRIGLALFNGLRDPGLQTFPFPHGQQLRKLQTHLLDEKPLEYFSSGTVRFKTMSPVLLTNGDKKGAKAVLHPATKDQRRGTRQRDNVVCDEESFAHNLSMSFKGHVEAPVKLIPEDLKVEVVHHTIGESMRAAGRPLKFVCFSGTFQLEGGPKDLHRVYQTGIGFKRNQGFGMVEVV